MPYAIIAEPVLGTYHAHAGDGEIDVVPSPARLAAALLCAAAQGPRAVYDGGSLRPCEVDMAALRWLETHPPDGVRVPELVVNRPEGLAYRTRLLEVRQRRRMIAKTPQPLGSVAVNGSYAWTWQVGPPAGLREAIEALCAEVSHLGMAETPVRMRVGLAEPTHDLVVDANWWDGVRGDLDLDVPGPGRAEALLAAYRTDNAVPPSLAADRVRPGTNETQMPPTRVGTAVSPARYAARRPAPAETPWDRVLVAAVDTPVPGEADRVRWAVAMHKALIKMIGEGAPAVLTGHYAAGVERPANRCAIQILNRKEAGLCGVPAESLIVMMLPADIDAADYRVIKGAWEELARLHPERALRLSQRREVSASEFWAAPEEGRLRVWSTVPAAVPETRGQGKNWMLADAVLLSVGMVLRDRLGIPVGRGSAWYRGVADTVRRRGVVVVEATPVRDGDLSRFVHKMPPGVPLRPYRAVIDLAGLVPARGLLAIGQSRHLGNGLLVPLDVPTPEGERP
ncbi:type I-U CRISPR-associated protein Csb2 [Thermopolyspora sp. NPDC052614]|uniref:type I-G CRISPR-associated protein Csb2 n=1 Tax=Thermopolyspora sp. NPDC052614 TaxID=3155682 RepID=UPI003414936E